MGPITLTAVEPVTDERVADADGLRLDIRATSGDEGRAATDAAMGGHLRLLGGIAG